MNKILKKLALILVMTCSMSLISGCSDDDVAAVSNAAAIIESALETADSEETEAPEADPAETGAPETDSAETEAPAETESLVSTQEAVEPASLDPDGSYDSVDDVALYIHQYSELPSNYITKKQAEKLGWSGGSLEPYAPGKCIGGSHFGNYEGILPEEDSYTECDIDTIGAKKRGAKRIVFSDDGDIYYTEDHYESFLLLYTAEGEVTEEIIYRKK